MTWCRVSPAGPSTKLTGVLGYLPSATSLVLCLEPTAVVRFALGQGSSCLCAPHGEQQPLGHGGETQHDNRIFNTQDKRHLFPLGLGQLVGHRSSHRSVPEASNYNKICLAQISAEDDASAAGSPSAGTQLHFFQPPTIQDTLPNGAARWAGRGAASSAGCGWLGTLFNPHQAPRVAFHRASPARSQAGTPSSVHGLDGVGSGRRQEALRQHTPTLPVAMTSSDQRLLPTTTNTLRAGSVSATLRD